MHTQVLDMYFNIQVLDTHMPGIYIELSLQVCTLRHVIPWSYDPLPSLGELPSSSLNRLSVCLSYLFCLCIPPVVYGRHIQYLRCLRVALFSEKKRGFFIFFSKKWTPSIKKKTVLCSPDVSLTSVAIRQLHPT